MKPQILPNPNPDFNASSYTQFTVRGGDKITILNCDYFVDIALFLFA
jgi:hypothetical protein